MTKKAIIAPAIEFGEFIPEAKVNPYVETVTKLAELDNENAAVKITVDANDAQKERFKFSKAANDIGKTARLRHTDDSNARVIGKTDSGKNKYDGTVVLTFTLTAKHKARRGNKD